MTLASFPKVSVAIPVYNEEETLPELLRRLREVLDQLPYAAFHEMVFVDDGSSDRTAEFLTKEADADPRVAVVTLSRNFGHQAALSAAYDYVTGDVVVFMDSDLQDPPEAIFEFLERYREGYEVVYAHRVHRKEKWWLRVAYAVHYRLLRNMSGTQLPVDAGDFCLVSRRVVDAIRSIPERHRYLRGLRAWVGFRQLGVDVERHARHHGQSKYGFRKLLTLALDGVFAFSVVPIRTAAALGAIAMLGAILFSLYSVVVRLATGAVPQGFTALILVITFMSGVVLFFLGVIGEYVGRVYDEVKARPLYVVDKVIRHEAPGKNDQQGG